MIRIGLIQFKGKLSLLVYQLIHCLTLEQMNTPVSLGPLKYCCFVMSLGVSCRCGWYPLENYTWHTPGFKLALMQIHPPQYETIKVIVQFIIMYQARKSIRSGGRGWVAGHTPFQLWPIDPMIMTIWPTCSQITNHKHHVTVWPVHKVMVGKIRSNLFTSLNRNFCKMSELS